MFTPCKDFFALLSLSYVESQECNAVVADECRHFWNGTLSKYNQA